MSQSVFTKPIWRFALGKVQACTGTINLMIEGLAVGLAGNTAFAIYDFHKPVQHQRNGFIDPGRIGFKNKFCLVRDLKHGSTEGDPSRGCRVLSEGVAFPIVGCYNRHRSIPHYRGVDGVACDSCLAAWVTRHSCFYALALIEKVYANVYIHVKVKISYIVYKNHVMYTFYGGVTNRLSGVYSMTLGERVLIWRRRRNLTQQALAEAVGIAKNTIARLEQGGITDLRGQVIARLAQVLGVSTDYLLGLDASEEAPRSENSERPKRAKGRPKVKA